MNFYDRSASLDVKLQGKMFINPVFHLFVCFFVRSWDRSCISSVCVKENERHMQVQGKSEWVPDKTALLFFLFQRFAQNVRMHMHIQIWKFVGHMYSWTPSHISCKSFSTVKTQMP